MTANTDRVFHREVDRAYPVVDRAEGIYVYDTAGRRYLDAAGGVFVLNIGHGVPEVADAMAAQARRGAFAHTQHFTTQAEQEFARRLIELAPPGFVKAWICTSGSAANETAIKLARQYQLLVGQPQRAKVISRWMSYHGSSIGALSLTGETKRREPFLPMLPDSPKIEPPYCYRCPYGATPDSCGTVCADALEILARRLGPQYFSAFIAEPVSGGPLGAMVPPKDYYPRIREICDRHGLLMIVDEVVTGAGRLGTNMGIDHWGVVPDIITLAKGIGGGYVPIGAVLVHERVYGAFERAGQAFKHGETFLGHAVVAAAGNAVLDYIAAHDLTRRAGEMGRLLGERLQRLRALPIVGDVRGLGLLWGVELVRDQATKAPFPRAAAVAEKIGQAAMARGLLVVPGTGAVNGIDGDCVTLSPPFIITPEQIDDAVRLLGEAIGEVAAATP